MNAKIKCFLCLDIFACSELRSNSCAVKYCFDGITTAQLLNNGHDVDRGTNLKGPDLGAF